MIFAFFGPPASGKGTQAKRLARRLKLPYVSLGAHLRERASRDGDLAVIMARGDLVDNTTVNTYLAQLKEKYGDQSFVLDGGLRTIAQIKAITRIWPAGDIHVVRLTLDNDAIIHRAHLRLENSQKRADDALTTVRHRVAIFRATESQLMTEMARRGFDLSTVSAAGTVSQIARQINRLI